MSFSLKDRCTFLLLIPIVIFSACLDTPSNTVDTDGDGTADEDDCSPSNPDVFPGAAEVCNGVDDDCDEVVDDGVSGAYYPDSDGDGFGDANGLPVVGCSAPHGTVANASDCADGNPNIHPDVNEVCDGLDNNCNDLIDEGFDVDEDGWSACDQDCDDSLSEVHPGQIEVCDGLDNNCNGLVDEDIATTWYIDSDDDGYGADYNSKEACERPDGYTASGGDCNDYNNEISPSVAESCNEIDDNCNGQVDEDLPLVTVYRDLDGDHFGSNNHSGTATCLRDSDSDDVGDSPPEGYALTKTDCDDSSSVVFPGAPELCDGRLNDCDISVADYQCPTVCEGNWPLDVGTMEGFPVVAQLDGDSSWEIVVFGRTCSSETNSNCDADVFGVFAVEHTGDVKWKADRDASAIYSFPTLANLNLPKDEDGDEEEETDETMDIMIQSSDEVIFLSGVDGSLLGTVPLNSPGQYLSPTYVGSMFDIDNDGNIDVATSPYSDSSEHSTMLLNSDLSEKARITFTLVDSGEGEVFYHNRNGLYDVDGDGLTEILIGSSGLWTDFPSYGRLYVVHPNGDFYNDPTYTDTERPHFEVEDYEYAYTDGWTSPLMADVDGDGIQEISMKFGAEPLEDPLYYKAYLWNKDGTEHELSGVAFESGFPVLAPVDELGQVLEDGRLRDAGGPVVDLAGDGDYEIFADSAEGLSLYHRGEVMDGYPLSHNTLHPVVADINRDGRLDLLFLSLQSGTLNCYTLGEGTYEEERVLNFGSYDGIGRNWLRTGNLDPYEPNAFGSGPIVPEDVTDPLEVRAINLKQFRTTWNSGNYDWIYELRAIIGEGDNPDTLEKDESDWDYYYLNADDTGSIDMTIAAQRVGLDVRIHRYSKDWDFEGTDRFNVDANQNVRFVCEQAYENASPNPETILSCSSEKEGTWEPSDSKYYLLEIHGATVDEDGDGEGYPAYGPFPYRINIRG